MKKFFQSSVFVFLACVLSVAAPHESLADLSKPVSTEILTAMTKGDGLFATFHKDNANLAQAGAIYENVLEKNPNFVEAVWKLAEVQYLSGMLVKGQPAEKENYEKSLVTAHRALDLDPDCVPARFYSGCAQVSLAEMAGPLKALSLLKKGKADLFQTMELGPENRFGPLAASVLSQVNTETPWPMRDLDEAQKLALKAIEWDTNLTMARVQLARVHLAKKDYSGAAREAMQCLSVEHPTYQSDAVVWDWPEARTILASAKEKQGG